MNAIEFLTQDHKDVDSIFKQIQNDPDNGRVLAGQLRQALLAHCHIEEQIFYPVAGQFDELKEMVDESLQEHAEIERRLEQMSSISLDSKTWESIFNKIQKDVE